MAEIKAFRGIRYNQAKVALDNVTAPPYDIISPQEQEGYYKKSPHNIVRLDFGQILPTDSDNDNRYSRSAADLSRWLEDGILVKDDTPRLYVYRQIFSGEGGPTQVTGIVCLVKLTEFGEDVLPHEKTLSGPKRDRRQLLEACESNFSQVFALYSDHSGIVSKTLHSSTTSEPEMETTDADGVVHQMWSATSSEVIKTITRALADRKLLIADGHHRYETSLNYMKDMRDSGRARDSHRYIMMFLVDMIHEDLIIMPTHRVVKKEGFAIESFLTSLGKTFEVSEGLWEPRTAEEVARDGQSFRFGLYSDGRLLSLRGDREVLAGRLTGPNSLAWKRLDTTLLQETILGPHLDVSSSDGSLSFTQSDVEAKRRVDASEASLAVLLEPMLIDTVEAVAEAGDKMPQKSTYFYPKPRTGLILRDLE